jgi:DNA polymerase-1
MPVSLDDPRYIPWEGRVDSEIVVIGEAPGRKENTAKRPFVGASGIKLWSLLGRAGILRQQCWVGNAIPVHPPMDTLTRLEGMGVSIPEEQAECKKLVLAYPRRLVIVCGNIALQALTGLRGIASRRGSLLTSNITGLPFDVFCMIHPAAIFRDNSLDSITKADMTKLRRYNEDSNYDDMVRDLYIYGKHIRRSLRTRSESLAPKTCEYFLGHIEQAKSAKILCLDIETFQETITVFGFGTDEGTAVSVPFTGQFTEGEEAVLIEGIRDLLACPMPKVTQNGIYDGTVLADQWGVEIHNSIWDTMLMHHCIYSELRHGLDFLTSVYTDVPFFKTMAKEAEDINYHEAHWEYNALDVLCTMTCQKELAKEITHYDQWDVYWEYYMPLSHELAVMQRKGIALDYDRREELIVEYEESIARAQKELNEIVGENFNIKSKNQMQDYVHGILKLPKQKKRGKGSIGQSTLDKTARATLRRKFPKHIQFFDLVDEIAQRRDVMSKYLGKNSKGERKYVEDPDRRVRTSFNIAGNSRTDTNDGGTETGRLSSSTNCYGRGCNMQNQPKNLRDLYIPDPGYTIWQADWSSAESYIVGWLSADPAMLEILTNHRIYKEGAPNKVMMHESVGKIITGLPLKEIKGTWRDLAKRCGHARNYGVSPQKLAETVNNLLPQIPFTTMNATKALNDLDNTFWGIKEWKANTRRQITTTRKLMNIFGHQRIFFGRFGDGLFREAYAHVPQSSVGEGLNRMLIQVGDKLRGRDDIFPMLQVHDSIVGQCKLDCIGETEAIVTEILEQPLPCECQGMQLRIPADFSTGMNWKECG